MDNNNLYVRKNMHNTTVTLLVTSLVAILVIFISIGYSAINANLMISGDLQFYPIKDLYDLIAKESKGLDTNINFYQYQSNNEPSGVYKMDSTKNDKYPVYYYHGKVSNNNINFGGFCWKIVRTTSTGGIKLIYNGALRNGSCDYSANIGTSKFINSDDMLGFMTKHYYGYTTISYGEMDSAVKKYIDEWYLKNMTAYTIKLEDTEWCNDRSIASESYDNVSYVTGSEDRRKKPSIICSNSSDKYTVSSSKGNGKLKYPIGLLTVDEVRLAGYRYHMLNGINYNEPYLGTDFYNSWWLLSPNSGSSDNVNQYYYSSSYGDWDDVNNTSINDESIKVRPAISLISGTKISSGDGTTSNPYQVLGG